MESSAPRPLEVNTNDECFEFLIKWNGKDLSPVLLNPSSKVVDLKYRAFDMTDILPIRQKLLGLKIKQGKVTDETPMSDLILKKNEPNRIILMGTPEDQLLKEPDETPSVFNDFDLDYMPSDDELGELEARKRKLSEMAARTEIRLINPLRPGKKLLVLDLDYTLFDFKSRKNITTSLQEITRPGLEDFMVSCYEDYDFAVWSQTSWTWLEVKLTELGLLTHPRFKIAFVLDRECMFKVRSYNKKDKKLKEHEVKALGIIWAKMPQFNAKNTVHVDDLEKNFVMNRECGVKIKAYYYSEETKNNDKELFYVARYLKLIAKADDLTQYDHRDWKEILKKS
jgi:ubiquitin-like domain-containing CTD phosphatase 1